MRMNIGVGLSFGKPSRGKEAWSFAQAKVPKPNTSDWSRWSGMNVFAGNTRHQCSPSWKIRIKNKDVEEFKKNDF